MIVLFSISDGTLGHDILCVSARQEGSVNDNHVELAPCDSEDSWDYDPRLAQLRHQPSGQCLKVRIMTSQSPVLSPKIREVKYNMGLKLGLSL